MIIKKIFTQGHILDGRGCTTHIPVNDLVDQEKPHENLSRLSLSRSISISDAQVSFRQSIINSEHHMGCCVNGCLEGANPPYTAYFSTCHSAIKPSDECKKGSEATSWNAFQQQMDSLIHEMASLVGCNCPESWLALH